MRTTELNIDLNQYKDKIRVVAGVQAAVSDF